MMNIKNRNLPAIIVTVLFLLYVFVDISRPPVDLHQFRQTQTLSTIYNFFMSGVDLLHPELDTNGNSSIIVLELPLYQGIVAFLMTIFGYHEEIARILSILSMLIGSLSVAKASDRFINKGSFFPVYVFCLFTPSVLFWSTTILIDPFAVGLSGVVFYALHKWYNDTSNLYNYLLSIALGSLVVMIKMPAAFPLMLLFLLHVIFTGGLIKNFWKLLILGAVWLGALLLWLAHSKYWHGINPHSYTNGSISWYLGTFEQRLDPVIYKEFWGRLVNNHLAIISAPLALISLIYSVYTRNIKLAATVLSCALVTTIFLVFFINLNYAHTYYQLPLSFVLAVGSGVFFSVVIEKAKIRQNYSATYKYTLSAALLLMVFPASVYVINNKWMDVAPVSNPFTKSTCEYEIGSQIRSELTKYNVYPELIGVRFQTQDRCWSGPHAIMYYLRERGFVTSVLSQKFLDLDGLDMVIDIYRNDDSQVAGEWNKVHSKRLEGSVNDVSFDIYIKDKAKKSNIEKTGHVISGTTDVHFNEIEKLHEIVVPKYSNNHLNFSATALNSGTGYILMRSYKGGYDFDVYRDFKFKTGEKIDINMNLISGHQDDYVIILGVIRDAKYQIDSPISVTSKPIFEVY